MNLSKPKPMRPGKLWAVVDRDGKVLLGEFFYTRREVRNAITCCGLKGCRVTRVLITEVKRGVAR